LSPIIKGDLPMATIDLTTLFCNATVLTMFLEPTSTKQGG